MSNSNSSSSTSNSNSSGSSNSGSGSNGGTGNLSGPMCSVGLAGLPANWSSDGPLPDAVTKRFHDAVAAVGPEDAVAPEALDEVLLELVGSVVYGAVPVATAVGLLGSAELSTSPAAAKALTDTLWFWGSQVRVSSQQTSCTY